MKSLLAAWLGTILISSIALGDEPKPPVSPEDPAIRSMVASFVTAFGQGNAPAVAALFTEGAEATDHEGQKIQGRKALEAHYADRFTSAAGDKIEAAVEEIKILAPGVARLEGRTRLIPADGTPPITSRHSSMLAKGDQGWQIASIREVEDQAIGHHERLEELAWLVGDWIEETGPAVITTSMAWSEDGNFLLRTFEVRAQGRSPLKGSQRVGWDPLTRQIKSWTFDSMGGYGDGHWVRNGEQWTVKSTGVRPDGLTSSATQVLIREGRDRILWKSIDRTLGGEAVQDLEEVIMVRKPPEPKKK